MLRGTDRDDVLNGGKGDDSLSGGKGNDTLTGGPGNDLLAGDEGTDTAIFTGAAIEYRLVFNSSTGNATITDRKPGRDGVDELRSIEVLRFSNGERKIMTDPGGDDRLTGGNGDDILFGGKGNDILNGGSGLDVAVYAGTRAAHAIAITAQSVQVRGTASGVNTGTDTLTNIERLQFTDLNIALDLNGAAGTVARLLGSVFGAASVKNKEYAGIGLALLDRGMSADELAALAVSAAGASGPENVVRLLWTNVVGSAPTNEQAKPFVDMLAQGTTVAQLTMLAAATSLNEGNINLMGLLTTGLEYLPTDA